MDNKDVAALRPGWQGLDAPPDPDSGDGELLSIGAFSRRSRLSQKALRLYDRIGVLVPAHVDETNGYRRYRRSQLGTARLVAMLRRLDMPLAEVSRVVSAPAGEAAELVEAYWAEVERRVAFQRELAAHLRIRLAGGEALTETFGPMELRDVPEQLVLTEQRHLRVEELPVWLGTTIGRLAGAAGSYGGITAPVFVIYHGEVNQDSDGPVEICVPIAGETASASAGRSGETAIRREPARRLACVPMRKAQVAYPQILSAFDAAVEWVRASGLAIAAPPREIYRGISTPPVRRR